jgi:uncharacterized protein YceK
MKTPVSALLALMLLSGCATTLTSYKPADTPGVTYNQGVGSIASESGDALLTIYPTFRYQSDADLPTFTLMVRDNGSQSLDFDPESVRAFLDDRECHIYTLEERVGEIRRQKRRKQIALAIAGGLAAGASVYAASHSTTTYTGYGYVGHRAFYTTGTIQTYDPVAGILAGAVVGAATGVGISQIENAAGYQEQAAQGIFQHSTIAAGSAVVGQIMLKPDSPKFGTLKLKVSVGGELKTFTFVKSTTSY